MTPMQTACRSDSSGVALAASHLPGPPSGLEISQECARERGRKGEDPAACGCPELPSVHTRLTAEQPPGRLPSVSPPADRPVPAHSGALYLCPVPLVQDVLQQPVHHIQRLVLLQHNVIGGHVALPPLLHLPGRGDRWSSEMPALCPLPLRHLELGEACVQATEPLEEFKVTGLPFGDTQMAMGIGGHNKLWGQEDRNKDESLKARCYL